MKDYNIPLDEDQIAKLMTDFSNAMSRDDHETMRQIFFETALRLTVMTSQRNVANYYLDAIKSLAYAPPSGARFQFDPVVNRLMMGKRFEEEIVRRNVALVRQPRRG